MSAGALAGLPGRHAAGDPAGMTSVCSAHPLVIEAALLHARDADTPVLIEATCNQVNQDGGYTGMTPGDFRRLVEGIAGQIGLDRDRIVLGGDHLGPNPWRHLPAPDAMARACLMVRDYAEAGFAKIHLDASMGCLGEGAALPGEVVASRAAALAAAAEGAVPAGGAPPAYVIGTEVPTPGGAVEALDRLAVTTPQAMIDTVAIHREAFATMGLEAAFARAMGLVVQPGVEFGDDDVAVYRPDRARALAARREEVPQFVFEAHSTDYQPAGALAALVRDGFAILKVGPALTFALREALYGLDHVAAVLDPERAEPSLPETMEAVMLDKPGIWQAHHHDGDPARQRLRRHFGLSDRIRYAWPDPRARAAVDRLLSRLGGGPVPDTLVSQYLGRLHPAVVAGEVAADPRSLLVAAVQSVLKDYAKACGEPCGPMRDTVGGTA